MSAVDFFNSDCLESLRTDIQFGLCDDETHQTAYTDTLDSQKWIAQVNNPLKKKIAFYAIDNCQVVLQPGSLNRESTCDGMLVESNKLILVELKNRGIGGWRKDAISQLENTIRLMSIHHDLSQFKLKKAYACNRKHPQFAQLESELKLKFRRNNHGFHLDIQSQITLS